MNKLNASFFENYGLLIILLLAFVAVIVYYFLKNKKYQETEGQFQSTLKAGDKVKTYSGFYGVIEKITETTDGKVVTLKLGDGAFIDVDIKALMGLDKKTEIVEDIAEKEDATEIVANGDDVIELKQDEVEQTEPKEESVDIKEVASDSTIEKVVPAQKEESAKPNSKQKNKKK